MNYGWLEEKTPVLFFRLRRIKRFFFEKKMKSLSSNDIKVLDAQLYEHYIGKKLDWNNLQSYTEKMQWYKICDSNERKSLMTDKYRVRAIVGDIIGEQYLIPLLGCYKRASRIDFSMLPNKFVLKVNSGSGDTIIVRDKEALTRKDMRRIRAQLDYYLHCDFSWNAYELHYSDIQPVIIAEELIECDQEDLPDYKFLCFNGKPYYCWVDTGRYHDHKRNVYDLEWNLQEWNQSSFGNTEMELEKPQCFNEMVGIAEKLSKGFSHVRVDLYNVKGRIYFGEMTFSNGRGFDPIIPEDANAMLGAMWDTSVN